MDNYAHSRGGGNTNYVLLSLSHYGEDTTMTKFFTPDEFNRTIQRKKGMLAITFDNELSNTMKEARSKGAGEHIASGMVREYAYRTCYRQYHEAIIRAGLDSTVKAHTGMMRDEAGNDVPTCYLSIKIAASKPAESK